MAFCTFTKMNLLYNISAHVAYFLLHICAFFNKKINLFVKGRKEIFTKLASIKKEDRVVWIHAASLGEFEQARPIIEKIKQQYTNHKIVVTFFSPSGYEVRKNYELADVVCYLPFDTWGRVKKFVNKIDPELAILVKYEFWPNLLRVLKKQSIPTILISGIFRENQSFFKPLGFWMRERLKFFDHFFVQDENSKRLLSTIKINNVTISGDTRFDRVFKILKQDNSLDFIEKFKNEIYTVVAGSTWQEDEELLVNYINNSEGEKFIIAPHNMRPKEIEKLKNSIKKEVVLFSEKENKNLANYDVFIVDTIGLLTKIYSYADTVYVGGGFKTGLHNILEPATFGIPVIIGPNYKKFKEAIDLVDGQGCTSVSNQKEFSIAFNTLKTNEKLRKQMGESNQKYIQENKGATVRIMNYINQKLTK